MYTYSEKRSLNATVVNKKGIFEYIVFKDLLFEPDCFKILGY